jgi:hypothetical protein
MTLIDFVNFEELLIRFGINTLVLVIIIRLLYYPITKRRDYLFTYFLVGTMVFLLCYMLENVKLQLGLALGLFAIFGIIRYRTDSIPIKEMTYLFIVIGLSVVNALTGNGLNVSELAFTNISVIIIAFILEKVRLLKNESNKILVYDKIELIKPENRQQLLEDLISKTGINIKKVEIGRIDFVRNTVRIKIYYFESPDESGFEAENDNWKNTDEF